MDHHEECHHDLNDPDLCSGVFFEANGVDDTFKAEEPEDLDHSDVAEEALFDEVVEGDSGEEIDPEEELHIMLGDFLGILDNNSVII